MDRLLERTQRFEISRFDRKRVPIGPRLALERLVQGITKLGDGGSRIGRPVLEPLLQDPTPICVEILTLLQAPSPPDVGCHAKDRAKTVPGARRVAPFLTPLALEQDQDRQALTGHHGFSGRVCSVGLFGPLLKQFDCLTIRKDPLPRLRIGPRPGERHAGGRGSERFLRAPKKCEGILIVRNAEAAERPDIERLADVREPIETRQPPDCKRRGGQCKADHHDERGPHQLAESLAQQLEQLFS